MEGISNDDIYFFVVKHFMRRKGTVIFLHGWAQNSYVMKCRTQKLATKLVQAGYECVYPDAPHLLPPPPTNYSNEGVEDNDGGCNKKCSATYNRVNARAWYMYSTDDPSDTSNSLDQTPMEYVGLQLSIDCLGTTLQQIMQQKHPQYSSNHGEHKDYNNSSDHEICAIFGFSQGATMAHILSSVVCSLSSYTTKHNNLKEEEKDTAASLSSLSLFAKKHCVILVSGFPSMHNVPTLSLLSSSSSSPMLSSSSSPMSSSSNLHNGTNNNNNKVTIATETNNKQKINIKSLHVHGKQDTSVPNIYIERLVQCYIHPTRFIHDSGHVIPQNHTFCQAVIDFLDSS